MSEPIDDGGPAFPRRDSDFTAIQTSGISIRDWFAGQALTGFCANSDAFTDDVDTLANWAYQQADAMLKARAAK